MGQRSRQKTQQPSFAILENTQQEQAAPRGQTQDQEKHEEAETPPRIIVITAPPTKEGNIDQDWEKQRKCKNQHMEDPRNRPTRNKHSTGRSSRETTTSEERGGADRDLNYRMENAVWNTPSETTEQRHVTIQNTEGSYEARLIVDDSSN